MDQSVKWYRIKELEARTGVSRRNVHFYLQQGLLHPPRRTGRTMAYYDDAHVAALRYIRQARATGAPLFAIKEDLAARFGIEARQPPSGPPATSGSRTGARRSGAGTSRRGRPTGRREMRARILELGCRLFLSKGFHATTVSDITHRLGVGKGTFYFYFADKEQLFLECAPRIFQELFASSWENIRRERDPLRRLERRAEAVLPVLDSFCAILALSREALRSRDPKMRRMGRETILSICKPLEDDLAAGVAQDLIRPLDARTTSIMLIGVMESLQYLQATGSALTPAALREAVSSLLLAGIRAGPAATRSSTADR